jgi:hypothetical protein
LISGTNANKSVKKRTILADQPSPVNVFVWVQHRFGYPKCPFDQQKHENPLSDKAFEAKVLGTIGP